MDTLDRMRIFVRAAEVQNFSRVADSLNLPKATVSTSIRDLENSLNVRLFHRTTRRVQLTHDGAQYLVRCQEILNDLDEVNAMFRRSDHQIKGRIRVDMAASLANKTFLPALGEFLERYPGLEIELSCSDQTVDLVRDGIDCVIRSGTIAQAGTIEKVLGQARMVNCASPSYLKKFGLPLTIDDLEHHRLVFYTQLLGSRRWGFEYFDGKEYREIKMRGNVTVNNTDAYHTACIAGLGILQTPFHGVKNLLASGELIEILHPFQAEPLTIKLVYLERRLLPNRVRVLTEWLEIVIQNIVTGNGSAKSQ